ncbi:MAG: metallophosphoesterase family protein [Thermogemmatispora sp.]|uniref:metallophosphoesterase family protein n=1 Tax=Thermogemmatispora sp. TaxID=1968838 RepID=UPI0026334AC4|nr:metallophosphoesterase family protein [Thermogemmatispora sp.]MBX5455972.1 metallophosphoesterase family protein [Thermogemmatispora sp.]
MEHIIGVLSDTHIPRFKALPEAIWRHFADVELIIHAGDLSVLSVISELETIAPVVAVQGNVESDEVRRALPLKRELVIGGCRIGVVHILSPDSARRRRSEEEARLEAARREFPQARCVIFGHTHVPYLRQQDGLLLFNPGSATDRRSQPVCTLGRLYIEDASGSPRGEIIPLT